MPFHDFLQVIIVLIQAPVVPTSDNAIHWINHYPADSVIDFCNTYPLDIDLSGGERYPTFEQPGPVARFSRVPIINGPVKLSLFTRKIEVSIVLHLT